jgi:hypothetical protein
MENQTFAQKIEELLRGDTSIMITNFGGRAWTLEGEGGRDLNRVGLYVHTKEKCMKDDKELLVKFNMRDFMLECDRLELNYYEMLKTVIVDLITASI